MRPYCSILFPNRCPQFQRDHIFLTIPRDSFSIFSSWLTTKTPGVCWACTTCWGLLVWRWLFCGWASDRNRWGWAPWGCYSVLSISKGGRTWCRSRRWGGNTSPSKPWNWAHSTARLTSCWSTCCTPMAPFGSSITLRSSRKADIASAAFTWWTVPRRLGTRSGVAIMNFILSVLGVS